MPPRQTKPTQATPAIAGGNATEHSPLAPAVHPINTPAVVGAVAGAADVIVLVEDDASLRQSLREFLHDHGYRTFTAATAREAWEMLRAVRPALCLLDLNLPDGSGLDLLRRVTREGLSVPVIVMTALPPHPPRPSDPDRGVVAWLTKPVPPEQLLETVRAALRPARPAGHGEG